MPKLMGNDASQNQNTLSGFSFTGTPVDKLGASEYTIVTVLMDVSGSVAGYERDLEKCIQTIVKACRKNPRADNLLLRFVTFNDYLKEVHGYVELMKINEGDYSNTVVTSGSTALYDALLNGIETTAEYAKDLDDKDIFCNAVVICITDGQENASRIATIGGNALAKIAKTINTIRQSEVLESMKTILIGLVGAYPSIQKDLDKIKTDANLDEFIALGSLSVGTLAKLAGFVSHSISSTSQALNTGGPSKPINPNTVQSIDLNSI